MLHIFFMDIYFYDPNYEWHIYQISVFSSYGFKNIQNLWERRFRYQNLIYCSAAVIPHKWWWGNGDLIRNLKYGFSTIPSWWWDIVFRNEWGLVIHLQRKIVLDISACIASWIIIQFFLKRISWFCKKISISCGLYHDMLNWCCP